MDRAENCMIEYLCDLHYYVQFLESPSTGGTKVPVFSLKISSVSGDLDETCPAIPKEQTHNVIETHKKMAFEIISFSVKIFLGVSMIFY